MPPGLPPGQPAGVPSPTAPPPGWYHAEPGWLRWWAGSVWGAAVPAPHPGAPAPGPGLSPDSARTLALVAHLGGLVAGFVPPLVVYLSETRDPFVRHHATEALNFHLTALIAIVASFLLLFVVVGLLTLLATIVLTWVFGIIATVRASQGQWYRYPICIRMVKGAAAPF